MKRTGLKRDTDKARAFQQRGRQALNANPPAAEPTPLARSSLKPRGRKTQPRTHPHARARALSRSGGLCIVCLYNVGITDVRRVSTRRLQDLVESGAVKASRVLHHVFPKQRWPALITCDDNQVDVCDDHHNDHEFKPDGRIPRAALPECSVALATTEPMRRYLDATYP